MDFSNVVIRAGTESDCDEIMQLIMDLAVYEGMPDQVKITAEDLKRDAFQTSPPVVFSLVAESASSGTESKKQTILGYALYYKTYSAWSGQAMHLEDLFVRSEYRHKGIGDKFFKYLAKIALEENYPRITWECIDWNESAIKFYKKYGAEDVTVKENWHNYRLDNDTLKTLVLQ